MPRDPGAVQRAMKKESAERKKDAEFIKKYGLNKPTKKKSNSSPCGTMSPSGKMRNYK